MGADQRMFAGLGLHGPDILGADWIPHHGDEDLDAYALRFARHHGLTTDDILIGVSMGGMVAASIAKSLSIRRPILVSTCTDIRQAAPLIAAISPLIPWLPFGLTRCLPTRLRPQRVRLLLTMFETLDPAFIRWACGAIRRWPGVPRPPEAVTIHGSADRLFPLCRQPQVDAMVAGGGHFMVMERPREVAAAIRTALPSIRFL